MFTPVMHILSCLDDKYEIGSPADILYLSKSDRELIIREACRLGKIFDDENKVWITNSNTGLPMVSEIQAIAGTSKQISPYTALLLTRIHECFPVYLQEIDTVSAAVAEDDLSTDAVVLRLEGNPRYVYVYVYNIMELPSLSYDVKIARLKELLVTIQSHSVIKDTEPRDSKLRERLELHSKFSYWKGMLMADYVKYYGVLPPPLGEGIVDTIRSELSDMGFYGFVDPLKMYQEFNSSRISRKVEVNIDESVIHFLTKVVLSGGATIE